MSRTLLIECGPRRPADGVVVGARYVYKSPGAANFLGVQWEPVVEAPPTFESSIGFDGRSFGASPAPQTGSLEFFLNDRTRAAASLAWKNAVITIKSAPWPVGGGNPANGSFTTIWAGLADDIAAGQAKARVTMLDGGQLLRTPLASVKFGASGDALLDSADAVKDRPAGAVVPLAFGRLLSIEGKLVDRANNIWLFAGRPATAVAGFYDGGAAFATGVARASLATLIANVPAAGAVDYVLDSAGKFLARPWDRPTYPFTADATFGSARAADIAAAIVALRGGPAFTVGTVAAFNALQAADCGLYVDDDTATGTALDRLFLGLGTLWRLNSAGTIDIIRIGWATPALTVPAHRRGAPERLRTILPTARRSLGYAKNNRVHSDGEIAAILLATDLAYADGTTVEALKPAAAGADVTAANTAANANALGGTAAATVASNIVAAGTTATWPGIAPGSGKPDDNATSGDNQILNADLKVDTSSWSITAGVSRVAGLGTDPSSYFQFSPGALRTCYPNGGPSNLSPLHGAPLVFVSAWAFRLSPASGPMGIRVTWNRADGSAVGDQLVSLSPTASNLWERVSGVATAPTNAAYYRIELEVNVTGAVVNLASSRSATTQVAADVTAAQPVVSRLNTSTGRLNDRRGISAFFASGAQELYSTNPITAADAGGSVTITINAHDTLDDVGALSFSSATLSGLAYSTLYYVYEDNPTFVGGARSYVATTSRSALASAGRRFVGFVTTPASGGGSSGGSSGGSGGGWSGGGGTAIP